MSQAHIPLGFRARWVSTTKLPTGIMAPMVVLPKSSVEIKQPELRTPASDIPEIEAAIELSRRILDLPEDWDEQGAVAIQEATWLRATHFLWRHAHWLLRVRDLEIEVPKIDPLADGSIDLHWEVAGEYELLLNFPADPAERARFYGDTFEEGAFVRSDKVDPNGFDKGFILWWLTRNLTFDLT